MVDISSDVHIKTFTNKAQPYINDIIDFTIKVENRIKSQKEFILDIKDISDYSPDHNINDNYDGKDYIVEYVDAEFSEFTINNDPNNIIWAWTLDNIPANATYQLTLSLRSQKPGLHTIHTDFTNNKNINKADGIQLFNI